MVYDLPVVNGILTQGMPWCKNENLLDVVSENVVELVLGQYRGLLEIKDTHRPRTLR